MIFQFGTSRFLQAHVDLFAWEAALAEQAVPDIAIVQVSGDPGRAGRLAAFDDPAGFPVLIRGLEDGAPVERRVQVRSVKQGLSVGKDWDDVCVQFVDRAHYIVSNSGDAGYEVTDTDRAPGSGRPGSFCAILLDLLHLRWQAGGAGVTMLPCELVASNGRTLHRTVRALARDRGLDAAFLLWLDTQCRWVNTLVDRIVSEPLDPAGAVAEPYALWAIEDQPGLVLPFTHPAVILTPDIQPYERLKLHILNLGHSWLAEQWHRSGADPAMTVLAMMADDQSRAELVRLYAEEVIPGFAVCGMGEAAQAYVAQTMQRFANPYLRHRLSDIHSGHQAKIDKRIGRFLQWVDGSGVRLPLMRLRALMALQEGQI